MAHRCTPNAPAPVNAPSNTLGKLPDQAPDPTCERAPGSLWRASGTLLVGGTLAALVPLALGPLLTRLYTPEQWGVWQLFASVAAVIAVVACGRFEFALPLEPEDDRAQAVRSLACWCLALAVVAAAVIGWSWHRLDGATWPLWLPLAVAASGWLSLATLWATRAQRFRAMAVSRLVQQGGGALAQAAAGVAGMGLHGLLVAPVLATLAAVPGLRLPWRGTLPLRDSRVLQAARRHRDFARFNAPHAWSATAVEALSVALIAAVEGVAAAGFWGLAMRYLKAPATLVGTAVSQALYARLAADAGQHDGAITPAARADVRRTIAILGTLALAGALVCLTLAPIAFVRAFGDDWRAAGVLAQTLSAYLASHFVASPMAVVTMAWNAQAWALKVALLGQLLWLTALALGLSWGGLQGAGWAVSATMTVYFGWYLARLACWPLGAGPGAGAVRGPAQQSAA